METKGLVEYKEGFIVKLKNFLKQILAIGKSYDIEEEMNGISSSFGRSRVENLKNALMSEIKAKYPKA